MDSALTEAARVGIVGRLQRRLAAERIVTPIRRRRRRLRSASRRRSRRGGPTVCTKATVPDWDGYTAATDKRTAARVIGATRCRHLQYSPEYQKRMVQTAYHEGVTARRSGARRSLAQDSRDGGRSRRRPASSSP